VTVRPAPLAVVLLALAGCGPAKLDLSKTYNLGPAESQPIELPAQPVPQRLTVEFDSTAPIEVAIFKSADLKGEDHPVSKALAIEKKATKGSLAADLGPDTGTTVVISAGAKAAEVKVRLTNRK
jgi:hypothetical protein